MSAVVYTVVTAIVVFYVWLAVCLYRREQRRPLERDRIIAAARDSYVGPDSLRLLQDLDAHLDAYADQVAGLYEQPPVSPDPVLAAGHARLTDAIHNDQTKGNQ
ncbi:hypothetical protein [Streptomyces chartreusis]|uniref:hypothetical protein n=1 Tax=Streptomyces chartreusis TaxID=1969 RepID=UPI0037F48638